MPEGLWSLRSTCVWPLLNYSALKIASETSFSLCVKFVIIKLTWWLCTNHNSIFFITLFTFVYRIPTSDKIQPSNIVTTQKKTNVAPNTIFTPRTPNKLTNSPSQKKTSIVTAKWDSLSRTMISILNLLLWINTLYIWIEMALEHSIGHKHRYCDIRT